MKTSSPMLFRVIALLVAIGLFAGMWGGDRLGAPTAFQVPIVTQFSGQHTRPTLHQWGDEGHWKPFSANPVLLADTQWEAGSSLNVSSDIEFPQAILLGPVNLSAPIEIEDDAWVAVSDLSFESRLLAEVQPIDVLLADELRVEIESADNELMVSESMLQRHLDRLPQSLAEGRYRIVDSLGGTAWMVVKSSTQELGPSLDGVTQLPIISELDGESLCIVPVNETLLAERNRTKVKASVVSVRQPAVKSGLSQFVIRSAFKRPTLPQFVLSDWLIVQTWQERAIVDSYQRHYDAVMNLVNRQAFQPDAQQHAFEPVDVQ